MLDRKSTRLNSRHTLPLHDALPMCEVLLGIRRDPASQRYQSQREEEAEDHVRDDQRAIGHAYQSAEEQLAAAGAGSGGGIGHHVKGEEDKGDAGHRQQRCSERHAEDEVTDQSLRKKASYPSNGDADLFSEFDVEEAAAHHDDGRHNPASPAMNVFREVIRRRDSDPGEEQKRERDAEIRWVQEMA